MTEHTPDPGDFLRQMTGGDFASGQRTIEPAVIDMRPGFARGQEQKPQVEHTLQSRTGLDLSYSSDWLVDDVPRWDWPEHEDYEDRGDLQ